MTIKYCLVKLGIRAADRKVVLAGRAAKSLFDSAVKSIDEIVGEKKLPTARWSSPDGRRKSLLDSAVKPIDEIVGEKKPPTARSKKKTPLGFCPKGF